MKRFVPYGVLGLAAASSMAMTCDGNPLNDDDCECHQVGACEAPAGGEALAPLANFEAHCIPALDAPVLIDSEQAWNDAFGASGGCALSELTSYAISFETEQLVVLPGIGHDLQFLAASSEFLEVGVYSHQVGYPNPPLAYVVPRTGKPMRVHDCEQVCTETCPAVP